MLNTQQAISYNVGKAYSTKAIGLIQEVVRVPTKGMWNADSVTGVYKFQQSRPVVGTADGMMGPKTLGAMIGELRYVNRNADAAVLAQYPHVMPSDHVPQGSDPVVKFQRYPVRDFRFERYMKAGQKRWRASCQFDLEIELNNALPASELVRYEYRQFICGGIWVWTHGGSETDWHVEPNGNAALRVPPYAGHPASTGLPPQSVGGIGLDARWKEDGSYQAGKPLPYGYRKTATMDLSNEKDLWQPAMYGRRYKLRDTPSIAGDWIGWPIQLWIELYFRGYIVEVTRDAEDNPTVQRVVKKLEWQYQKLGNLYLDTYDKAVPIVAPAFG